MRGYYEWIGQIPAVNRNKGSIRDYNVIDLKRVEFIRCMRNAGLSKEALIEYSRWFNKVIYKEIVLKKRD